MLGMPASTPITRHSVMPIPKCALYVSDAPRESRLEMYVKK
jgi:hypothetical protein